MTDDKPMGEEDAKMKIRMSNSQVEGYIGMASDEDVAELTLDSMTVREMGEDLLDARDEVLRRGVFVDELLHEVAVWREEHGAMHAMDCGEDICSGRKRDISSVSLTKKIREEYGIDFGGE